MGRWIRPRPQFGDQLQDLNQQHSGHRDLGHLERDLARMRGDPGTYLHELLPEAGQRPVRDCLGQRQRAQENDPAMAMTDLSEHSTIIDAREYSFPNEPG